MKKKSISELIHFFVRHPLGKTPCQMKFWRWLVSPADAEDKEEAIQEEWMNTSLNLMRPPGVHGMRSGVKRDLQIR